MRHIKGLASHTDVLRETPKNVCVGGYLKGRKIRNFDL